MLDAMRRSASHLGTRAVGALCLSLAACGGEALTGGLDAATPEPGIDAGTSDAGRIVTELLDTAAWALLPAVDDPWADHLDPARPCDPLGLKDEGSFFEIDTRVCSAASVAQPLLGPIHADDELQALVWHLDLIADPPATGHVALTVGDQVLLEELVPIPSEEKVYEVRRRAGFEAPAGTRAVFHVHNHGYNNWRVAYLRVIRR